MQSFITELPGVRVLEPRIFEDARGSFYESYNGARIREALKLPESVEFCQDNQSESRPGVLRGLHYQIRRPQGKLVRVLAGAIYDVAVDLRQGSPSFGRWIGRVLSAENRRMLWVPPGFGHGFLALDAGATVLYKTTDYYFPEHERCVRWNAPDLAIDWPLNGPPLLSPKDNRATFLSQAETYAQIAA